MAVLSDMNINNIEGEFFVDNRCIGCMSCESFASDTFVLKVGKAYVYSQPTQEGFKDAAIAFLSCPVDAIGVKTSKKEIREVKKLLPIEIFENIYYCSYNSQEAFGANSYLIKRERGNILIDCPKFTKTLLEKIELLGGIKYIYLTHKDDIGEYLKFKEYFNAQVIFHEGDFCSRIRSADITLRGEEDYILDDEVKILSIPGHTKGHTALLYKTSLFTGDHLAYKQKKDCFEMYKNFCWYDWKTQVNSSKKLLNYEITNIFAGHGGNYIASEVEFKKRLKECLERES